MNPSETAQSQVPAHLAPEMPSPTSPPADAMTHRHMAMSSIERLTTLLLGGSFIASGVMRRGWQQVALLTLGAGVSYRGLAAKRSLAATARAATQPQELHRAVTIQHSPEVVYRSWRTLENLPQWMEDVQSITITDERHSRWKVRGPLRTTVKWVAEITDDQTGRLIAWTTQKRSQVATRGTVTFTPAPAGRGTVVNVHLTYQPPAGPIGAWVARSTGANPETQLRHALRRFKEIVEAGEAPTIDGQPMGK
ncbi:MAG: SRPBCC family protein [Ktedonobacterales bacterium]|nr:SRPBCC family protein [Ktedonobacterales bacterium]